MWLGRWPQWCRYKVTKMFFLPLLSDFRLMKSWRIFLETPTLVFIHPVTVFFHKQFEDLFSEVGGLDFWHLSWPKTATNSRFWRWNQKPWLTLPSSWKHWKVACSATKKIGFATQQKVKFQNIQKYSKYSKIFKIFKISKIYSNFAMKSEKLKFSILELEQT
jgi:hypothetical protein